MSSSAEPGPVLPPSAIAVDASGSIALEVSTCARCTTAVDAAAAFCGACGHQQATDTVVTSSTSAAVVTEPRVDVSVTLRPLVAWAREGDF